MAPNFTKFEWYQQWKASQGLKNWLKAIKATKATVHSAAACIYSEFSKFGLHAYFWKIQVILRCRNPFLAFFSDCAVDFKGPTSDTFSYVFPIPSTEKQLKQL